MDISKYTKAGVSFLKADDVLKAKNPIFTITHEAVLVEKDWQGKKSEKLQIQGELEGKEFKMDLSKTNARKIVDVLSADTKKWIGSQIVLTVYKTMATDGPKKGQLVDALMVAEVKHIV